MRHGPVHHHGAGDDRLHHAEQAGLHDQGEGAEVGQEGRCRAAVKVTVTNEYSKAGGAIPGRQGRPSRTARRPSARPRSSKGKYVIKVKGLAKGSHTLVVSYKGDDFVGKASSKELTSRSPESQTD